MVTLLVVAASCLMLGCLVCGLIRRLSNRSTGAHSSGHKIALITQMANGISSHYVYALKCSCGRNTPYTTYIPSDDQWHRIVHAKPKKPDPWAFPLKGSGRHVSPREAWLCGIDATNGEDETK